MRDYMISEAQSRQAYGRLTWVMRVVTNWRMRQTLKHLQSFNDYQLREIGLSRDTIQRLSLVPLNSDVAWNAERDVLFASKAQFKSAEISALPKLGRATSPWLNDQTQNKIQRGTFAA